MTCLVGDLCTFKYDFNLHMSKVLSVFRSLWWMYEVCENYHCCLFSSQSLLSPTAFSYASQYIARYEEQGIGRLLFFKVDFVFHNCNMSHPSINLCVHFAGLQWENMYSSPVQDDTTSFGWLCCLILADSFIYFLIAWYVRNVFPGMNILISYYIFSNILFSMHNLQN